MGELWLPILLTTLAIHILSALSWMMLPNHKADWKKLSNEDDVMGAVGDWNLEEGYYMFPYYDTPEQMKSEEFAKKWKDGPRGFVAVMPMHNMGKNIGLTLLCFLVGTFCIGYLAHVAVDPGASFMEVFRFVATLTFLTHFAALVPGAVWYRNRITGHLIDAVGYSVAAGLIFAGLWPAA